MKFLIVLAAVAAIALAQPGAVLSPYAYNGLYSGANFGYSFSAPSLAYSALPYNYGYSGIQAPLAYSAVAPTVAVAPIATGFKSQYHAQDELGQASYGHSEPLQTHNAVQDAFGNKVGSYSYISPEGKEIRTDYVADAAGYRVASNALPVGPSALPVGPADTPEVVAARIAHLTEFAAVKSRSKRAAPQFYAASPLGYAGFAASPVAYAASPIAYGASPLAYASAPIAYSGVSPVAAVREATLTQIVNNPGHAVSYRVD